MSHRTSIDLLYLLTNGSFEKAFLVWPFCTFLNILFAVVETATRPFDNDLLNL